MEVVLEAKGPSRAREKWEEGPREEVKLDDEDLIGEFIRMGPADIEEGIARPLVPLAGETTRTGWKEGNMERPVS